MTCVRDAVWEAASRLRKHVHDMQSIMLKAHSGLPHRRSAPPAFAMPWLALSPTPAIHASLQILVRPQSARRAAH
jgi:hypothetical protein